VSATAQIIECVEKLKTLYFTVVYISLVFGEFPFSNVS